MADEHPPLIWLELSTTGPEDARVLELATLITDGELAILAEGPELTIAQGEAALADARVDTAEAERQTLRFLTAHCSPGASPLCGDACRLDRRVLVRQMPTLEAFLHYRNIDVRTLEELARRWAPSLEIPPRSSASSALERLRACVAALRYYREHLFVSP